jgi:hypothetical protein
MFGCHQHCATSFSSNRETLCKAQDDEQSRSQDTDVFERWQTSDKEGSHSHNHECQNEHGLATNTIAEVTKDYTADRASGKANPERGVRSELGSQRGKFRRKEKRA